MIKVLKDENILKKKPDLKLYPNHYIYISTGKRSWNSHAQGTAYRDKKGWYKEEK